MTPKLPDSLRDTVKHMFQRLTVPVAGEFTSSEPQKDRDDDKDRPPVRDELHSWGWSMCGRL